MEAKSRYRILMFAPAFAPFANAEAIVNSKLALAMLAAGWEVDIISRDLTGISNYDYGSAWVKPWLRLRDTTHEIDTPEMRGSIRRKLAILHAAFKMSHPVDGCLWAARAYQYGMMLHRKQPYDIIMSRALPDSAHLPALKMARESGIPWIANWNDPWSFLLGSGQDFRKGLRGGIHAKFISAVADRASWLTYPSESLREKMCSYLGKDTYKKSFVIPHAGIDINFPPHHCDGTFRICYTGKLWPSQDPTLFFQAFKKLIENNNRHANLKFLFAGLDDIGIERIAGQLGIAEYISNLGRLSYLDSLKLAASADLLLVIDPPETKGILLTSKFVDYAQTGKPILVLTKGGGTLDGTLRTFRCGLAVSSLSIDAILDGLTIMFSEWKENLATHNISNELKDFFSPKKIIDQYSDLFERLK